MGVSLPCGTNRWNLTDVDLSLEILLLTSSNVFMNCANKSGISCPLFLPMILPKAPSSMIPQIPRPSAIPQPKTSSPVPGVP
jgi:hypothetical protein